METTETHAERERHEQDVSLQPISAYTENIAHIELEIDNREQDLINVC